MHSNRRVLVTGGAGFIGSHLCERLLARGDEVLCVDNFFTATRPIGPRSCYDEGKRCAETLFFDYHRQHKLRIKVARIFNTCGPRMHPNDGRDTRLDTPPSIKRRHPDSRITPRAMMRG
jgi:nucleoside-diphosphate-sugar epimerase